jgi:hypothetical protein
MSILSNTAAALYTTLAGGTALTALLSNGTAGIYEGAPYEGAAYDYVIYHHQGGGPDNINPSDMENNVWAVQCFSATSAKAAGAIFDQADALLHKKTLTIGSAVNMWTVRETNIKLLEHAPDGRIVWRAGGIYRIRTTGT